MAGFLWLYMGMHFSFSGGLLDAWVFLLAMSVLRLHDGDSLYVIWLGCLHVRGCLMIVEGFDANR